MTVARGRGNGQVRPMDAGVREGIAIAREMLERVRPSVQGVQVSAPFGKVELALEVFGDTLVPAAPELIVGHAGVGVGGTR